MANALIQITLYSPRPLSHLEILHLGGIIMKISRTIQYLVLWIIVSVQFRATSRVLWEPNVQDVRTLISNSSYVKQFVCACQNGTGIGRLALKMKLQA
jgi:hypothetical protein